MKKRLFYLVICLLAACCVLSGCMKGAPAAQPSAEPAPTAAQPAPTADTGAVPPDADRTEDVRPTESVPETENGQGDEKAYCTVSVECSALLSRLEELREEKRALVPSDGVLLYPVRVELREGDSVYSVLRRACRDNGIHFESSQTAGGGAYIEGIGNLYEYDCGELSGWMYSVDGAYPNVGCGGYALSGGETIRLRYTCELGADIGAQRAG